MSLQAAKTWDGRDWQLLSRWLLVATLAWTFGTVVVLQLRAPFMLRSQPGWWDLLTYLLWSAPVELVPFALALALWIWLAKRYRIISTNWVLRACSLALVAPFTLLVDLAIVTAMSFLSTSLSDSPTESVALMIAASLEHGQMFDWLFTHALMIGLPAIALDGHVRRLWREDRGLREENRAS
jgi:hypothetical protein